MTWQKFLRTLMVAAFGSAGLAFASQVKAEGGEGPALVLPTEVGTETPENVPAQSVAKSEAMPSKKGKVAPGGSPGQKPSAKTAAAPEGKAPPPAKKPEVELASAASQDDQDEPIKVEQTSSIVPAQSAAKLAGRQGDAIRAGAVRPLIARHAAENGLPVALADAVVRLESRYNAGVRNGSNMGLTQINVFTARSLGYQGDVAGLLDAETNLRFGLKYLAQAYRLAGGDTCGTILRYQFGHRTQTMTGASRAYCAKVKALSAAAQ